MFSRSGARAALPCALLLLAGCASVPDLGPSPALRTPESVSAQRSLPGSEAGAWPSANPWTEFGDPQLSRLVEEGLRDSPDVAAAMARLRRAAGLALEVGAARSPRVDAQGQVTLDKQSSNNGIPEEFIPNGWQDRGELAATLAFDPDLSGRNRAALAAAVSEERAAAVETAEVRLLLGAAIASAYSDLAADFAEQDVRQGALEVRQASRDLLARRLASELENRGAVRQADADVARARSSLEQATADVDLRRHQLAALVGAGPDRGLDIVRPSLPASPRRALPQEVTTELVGRRPDIVAARERVEAAAQRIKVARADFYPAIRLNALIGLQSLGLANLAQSGSVFGSVGPAISLPVFEGGALAGRYRVSRADFDAAVADYNKAVIDAYHQVADAVTTGDAAARRLEAAREALVASEEAYRVAQDRYGAGLSNRLQVLVVEDRLLVARLELAEAEAAVRSNDITLLRVLGGGFSDTRAGSLTKDIPNDA